MLLHTSNVSVQFTYTYFSEQQFKFSRFCLTMEREKNHFPCLLWCYGSIQIFGGLMHYSHWIIILMHQLFNVHVFYSNDLMHLINGHMVQLKFHIYPSNITQNKWIFENVCIIHWIDTPLFNWKSLGIIIFSWHKICHLMEQICIEGNIALFADSAHL